MNAQEFIKKYNIDLSKIHGNIGDYDGNMLIETDEGWEFWSNGQFEILDENFWR